MSDSLVTSKAFQEDDDDDDVRRFAQDTDATWVDSQQQTNKIIYLLSFVVRVPIRATALVLRPPPQCRVNADLIAKGPGGSLANHFSSYILQSSSSSGGPSAAVNKLSVVVVSISEINNPLLYISAVYPNERLDKLWAIYRNLSPPPLPSRVD